MPPMTAMSGCKAAPKYTFRGKGPVAQKGMTPGPGAYSGAPTEDRMKFSGTPKFSFGSTRRDGYGNNSATPGPGLYSPRDWGESQVLQQRQGFGGAGRRPNSPRLAPTPGPAAYETSPRMGEGSPKISMGSKQDLSPTMASPGPAAYQQVDVDNTAKMSKMPQHSFSRARRDGPRSGAQPGPGQYNPKKLELGPKSSEFSFGSSSRKDMSPRMEPGPGSYNVDTSPRNHKAPKFPLASRTRQTQSAILPTPGPGSYFGDVTDNENKYEIQPKFSFGTSPRELPNGMTSPGPGQYTPAESVHKPKAARTVIGLAPRANGSRPGSPRAEEFSPGPGTYNMSPRTGYEGPAYSAAGRQEFKGNMETPGPGSYQTVEPERRGAASSPRYGFGTAIRTLPRTVSTPGPGAYDSRRMSDSSSPQVSFGQRQLLKQDSSTTGPGSYDAYTLFN